MITSLTRVHPLHYWVQKVLPLVYDDSLSYYELLEKVVYKLNELIEANNGLPEAIENEIASQLSVVVPNEVYDTVYKLLSEGVLHQLIIDSATVESQKYLGQIFDTSSIDYLETVGEEPIFTVTGEYIFLDYGETPSAYTTDSQSYFYKYLKDATSKIREGKKPLNTYENQYLTEPPVLTLLHYSDYHGDNTELDYIYNNWGRVVDLCDTVLCTGDLVRQRFVDSFTYFASSQNIRVKQTLLTIGNHDSLAGTSGWDWSNLVTQEEAYNKFFAPTIANWGVEYTAGLTYYYKDYEAQNVRLIVLNDMLTGLNKTQQLLWLENTGLNTDKYVVIAKHYLPSNNIVKIDCTFTSIDWNTQGGGDPDIAGVVQRFINGGGKFVCYLVGHTHYDYVCYLGDYPSQIAIAVDAASREQCNIWSDVIRDDNEISRDLFNVVQIDTSSEVIKIIRCGCNYDRYLRHKNVLTMKFTTKEIISN